jgi:ATP-dependent protease ClpP protease subunit
VWRPGFESWVAAEATGILFDSSPAFSTLPSHTDASLAWISGSAEDRLPHAPAEDAKTDIPLRPQTDQPAVKKRNYLVRHWRGELSLPVSYWVNGLLATVAAVIAIAAIGASTDFRDDYDPTIALLSVVGIWVTVFVIVIWQVVGTWRSATNYKKDKFWGRVAKVVLVIGLIRSLVDFAQNGVPQIQEVYAIFRGDERVGNFSFRVLHDGRELEFSGGITFGAAKEFERFLNAMGGVEIVHLNSIGGRILEAQRIGNLIRSRNLSTYVSHQCLSACTIIFLSGRERLVTEQAKIGFHQPDIPGLDPEGRREIINEEMRRLRALGLSETFARKANQATPDDMWFPSTSELLAEKAVTRVVNAADFAVSGLAQSQLTDDYIERTLLANDLFVAIRRVDPETYKTIFERFSEGIRRGKTPMELRSDIFPLTINVFFELLPYASDDNLLTFTQSTVRQLSILNTSDPSDCYYSINPEKADSRELPMLNPKYKDLFKEEEKLEAQIISQFSGRDKQIPSKKDVGASIDKVLAGLKGQFGDDLELLSADDVGSEKYRAYCQVLVSMYASVLKLPRGQAVAVLRYIFAHQ